MHKNYLVTIFRDIMKHKSYSLINILGIALGTAACILIWQYVKHEKSYDTFHKKGAHIYRLELDQYKDGKLYEHISRSTRALGPTMKEKFPDVLEYTRLFRHDLGMITSGKTAARIEGIFCVDASFLTMFSFPLVKGDPATALAEPSSAVISESTARKFFGDEDPIGKTIEFDRISYSTYTIKGILKDIPANSHLQFDCLFSNHKLFGESSAYKHGWKNYNFYTYVLLKPDADIWKIETELTKIVEEHVGDEYEKFKRRYVYSLQPIRDIYLHSADPGFNVKSGDIKLIHIFSLAVIFILIFTWSNHVKLSGVIHRGSSKEAARRQIPGEERTPLINRFVFASGFFYILGVVLGAVLAKISTPMFNRFLGLPLSFSILGSAEFWLVVLVVAVPGMILSGISAAFKAGILKQRNRGIIFSKCLVVFQVAAVIVLCAGTVTFYKQSEFMGTRELGMNPHQVLVIKAPSIVYRNKNFFANLRTFLSDLYKQPTIIRATFGNIPDGFYRSTTEIGREGRSIYRVRRCWVDGGYMMTLQIKILAGRDFSKEIPTDYDGAAILNEEAVDMLGFKNPGEAIGQTIIDYRGEHKLEIIGVIKSYHHMPLQHPIVPMIFRYPDHYGPGTYTIKLKTENLNETIAMIKAKWEELLPGNPFIYNFLDDILYRLYDTERRYRDVFAGLTLLAIIIAFIGILGSNAHRLFNGTGILSIAGGIARDSGVLLLSAVIIAFPTAYFIFSQWLKQYAYHIGMGWWFFVIPPAVAILILMAAPVGQVVTEAKGVKKKVPGMNK